MNVIYWKDGSFKRYLCVTWQGVILWTLTPYRAMILPATACAEVQRSIKLATGIDTLVEETDIKYTMDKFNMENFPNP